MTLERKTPLERGTTPLRRVPFQRVGNQLERRTPFRPAVPAPRRPAETERTGTRPKRSARDTGAAVDVRELAKARDGGVCIICLELAGELDHIVGRGAGGTRGERSARINGVAWLRSLCGHGNASGHHGWKETNRDAAERLGHRLPRNGRLIDAARVPVWTAAGWQLFTDDGRRVPCPAPPNGDAREAWDAATLRP